jgi:hypothetical protein
MRSKKHVECSSCWRLYVSTSQFPERVKKKHVQSAFTPFTIGIFIQQKLPYAPKFSSTVSDLNSKVFKSFATTL